VLNPARHAHHVDASLRIASEVTAPPGKIPNLPVNGLIAAATP
jgi:hypothetical protein